jgi:hypothetical protein
MLKNTQPSSSSSIFDLELEGFEVELEDETSKALLSSESEGVESDITMVY